jgi:nucleotidyltransferase/DNA polymerase involved in DNA repair
MTIPYTFYDDELIAKAKELFHQLWRKGQPIRLLGVRLSELTVRGDPDEPLRGYGQEDAAV